MATMRADASRTRYQSRPGRRALVATSLADLRGLREASRLEDLTTYLDGDTLVALWPDLYLPKGVRQAWEDQHPALRAAAAAAA